ncbi:MAG TPA: squalene synthase HpnC [Firmicutes bacterium]|nr:squalene synthase HpnC [Bacillota bacterium]
MLIHRLFTKAGRTHKSAAVELAGSHYENFPVLSFLLPSRLRLDVARLYAYCRTVDDLGDEAAGDRTALLDEWEADVHRLFTGRPEHPVLRELQETVDRHRLPPAPFFHLIEANRRDQRQNRYDTWEELLDYCRYSANPVGRLYLHLLGYDDAERQSLADATCTALQLVNFWQDISVDAARNRIYIPREELQKAGMAEADVLAGVNSPAAAALIDRLAERTAPFFDKGLFLLPLLKKEEARCIRLFTLGGQAVLRAVVRAKEEAFTRRVILSPPAKLRLLWQGLLPYRPDHRLKEALAYTKRITKESARHFYPAFLTLPAKRRLAICAVYAFCRRVDDAVDLAPSKEEGQKALAHLKQKLLSCLEGVAKDPLFTALLAAKQFFPLKNAHLFALLDGVAKDLEKVSFTDWPRLKQYCLEVAGAPGLLALSIFGRRSEQAEDYAADLGLAMQITNIIRDVGEDYQQGRIYLPGDELQQFAVTPEMLAGDSTPPPLQRLLAFQAARARAYYQSATKLFTLLPRRSRFCPMALHAVYETLLSEMEKYGFDVLGRRYQLSGKRKAAIIIKVGWQWLLSMRT